LSISKKRSSEKCEEEPGSPLESQGDDTMKNGLGTEARVKPSVSHRARAVVGEKSKGKKGKSFRRKVNSPMEAKPGS